MKNDRILCPVGVSDAATENLLVKSAFPPLELLIVVIHFALLTLFFSPQIKYLDEAAWQNVFLSNAMAYF